MNFLPVLTRLRSMARRAGVLPWVGRILSIRAKAYEARFARALLDAVKPGDIVWDVGANLGYYTTQFAERVGRPGQVIAFEPVPSVFAELQKKLAGRPGVTLRQEALGSATGAVAMALAADPLGATHTLVDGRTSTGHATIDVPVRRGDDLVADGVRPPTVLKIDVEGFEEEVLNGMLKTLARPACRAIFIEVHFALLEKKGTPQAPQAIVATLRELGFRVRWLDPSHLVARR